MQNTITSMQNTITSVQKTLLDFCVEVLFDKRVGSFENVDFAKVAEYAYEQTVLTVVSPALKRTSTFDVFSDKRFMCQIIKNARVCCAHEEIHNILSENDVEYVVLKGIASATYYKQPALRTMGDVDLLVKQSDLKKCDELLAGLDYTRLDELDTSKGHIRYRKEDGKNWIICEVHRCVNGVPSNLTNITDQYFNDIFERSLLFEAPNSTCTIPSEFHHGLILLLHTASHLTSEGIGLRHLCDWAVFVNSLSNDEFVELFEKPLKEMGLWRFAQLLTLCCVRYLGCDRKDWTGEADDKLLEAIVADILDGGNFGFKDDDRYRQIKYIKNRNDKTVDGKKSLFQVFYTINSKAKSECTFVKKHRWLLPIGWVAVVFNYIWLVLSRKRKPDSFSTIDKANARKKIYSEFHLYKPE